MNILVTAFEPFGGYKQNSSLDLLKMLPNKINNITIHKLIIPVVYNDCFIPVKQFIERNNPEIIILLGQSMKANSINFERVALNIIHGEAPDNAGQIFLDTIINPQGHSAYFSTLPEKKALEISESLNIPIELSYSAGTYVCNNLMYHLLDFTYGMNIAAGLFHIPAMPSQVTSANAFSMDTNIAASFFTGFLKALK